jgi:2-polyprenyl-3-methyl-5-hydroxy-6-metoxy-1,4-benzoquinol methylase
MTFQKRSYQSELLDRNDIPFPDIKKNMQELDFINRWLGGHAISIEGLQSFTKGVGGERLAICEIGCGGGDNLRALKRWCEKKKINASFTGIDINPHCIAFAKERAENKGIAFICSDYRLVEFIQKPDIIFSSLFCHHFTDEGVTEILDWSAKNAGRGFFINDLHRHPLAYYAIRFLTQLFSRSYMVKNDAPLSVQRGFSRKEWQQYLQSFSAASKAVRWKWAFRWLVTVQTHAV